jgi:coenzyme F420-0:L-glutamate ligase / coenzyme F420-1:gamma-L-glutamate ligase
MRRRAPLVSETIQIFSIGGLPEIVAGDDLASLIVGAAKANGCTIAAGDVFVVAQKIISKAEGRTVALDSIRPSERAARWAAEYKKDPRLIELVLREAKRIVRMERGVIVAETSHGFVCANAGVDASNVPDGTALLLPEDPDRSASALRDRLAVAFGTQCAVIISDTFGRPWREGLVNVAIGVAGISPLLDYRGQRDTTGKLLSATIIAIADEIASAAELAMGKTSRMPVAIVRGMRTSGDGGKARELIRAPEIDIFR